ncbi:hypothetical protein H4Q26_011166 [Puccinia striiformis f. sp. tritici PST-130]|nr:hypothetical protein H4Q26_011166 [Puccinia striiformis f. sp. tritici PST-130]
MRPDQHKQNSRMDKGKPKNSGEVLARLNKLLEVLLIPISIPELSVITPSLLLAVSKVYWNSVSQNWMWYSITRETPVNKACHAGSIPGRPSKELISEDREPRLLLYPTQQNSVRWTFSPGGPPLDQSSRNLASSTTSSHSLLNRSINSQRHNEDPLSGQISNPPTLRNLLGPLHAQMINSKRPHTPRTAHRVMVDKLRNEDAHEDTEEQILNHDTDGWISAKTEAEENEESCIEESRFQYTKGPTLESQILQNQTTTSFDLTRLAVADSETITPINLRKTPMRLLVNPHRGMNTTKTKALRLRPGLRRGQKNRSSSSSSLKVLLASEGVKLDLVVSDVKSYEESKQERSNIEGWGWMDLSKLAQESEKLQQLGASMKIDNNINNHQSIITSIITFKKVGIIKITKSGL